MGDGAEEITAHPMGEVQGLEDIATRLQLYSSRAQKMTQRGYWSILINSGLNNSGYWLCPDCGRMEPKRHLPFYKDPTTMDTTGRTLLNGAETTNHPTRKSKKRSHLQNPSPR